MFCAFVLKTITMWFRVLLSIAVIVCTLSGVLVVSASNQTTPLKDIVCVLVMSGLNVEDLDSNLIEKLGQHNITTDTIDSEKFRQSCVNQTKSNIDRTHREDTTDDDKLKSDMKENQSNNNQLSKIIKSRKVASLENKTAKMQTNQIISEIAKNKNIEQNHTMPVRQFNKLFKLLYETEESDSIIIPKLSSIKSLTFIPDDRPPNINDIVKKTEQNKVYNTNVPKFDQNNNIDKSDNLQHHNTTDILKIIILKKNKTKQKPRVTSLSDKEIVKIVQTVLNNIHNVSTNKDNDVSKEILTSSKTKHMDKELKQHNFDLGSIININEQIPNRTSKFNDRNILINNNQKLNRNDNELSAKKENNNVTVLPPSIIHDIVERVQDIIMKKIETALPPKTIAEKTKVEKKEQENDKELLRDILHFFKELVKERNISSESLHHILNRMEIRMKANTSNANLYSTINQHLPKYAARELNKPDVFKPNVGNVAYQFQKLNQPKNVPLTIQTNMYEVPPLLLLQPSDNQQEISNLNIVVNPSHNQNLNIIKSGKNQIKLNISSPHKLNIPVKPKINIDSPKEMWRHKSRYKDAVTRSNIYNNDFNSPKKYIANPKFTNDEGKKKYHANIIANKSPANENIYDNVIKVDKINKLFNTFKYHSENERNTDYKNNLNHKRSNNKYRYLPNDQNIVNNVYETRSKEQVKEMIKTLDKEIEFHSNINLNERKQTPLRHLKKLRHSTYDDTHFQNFLKSQQKVNDMLDELLLTKKPSRNRMSSVEII